MATASASAAESIHPLAHAVGGSLGSALGLLLLYPLERARIELQSSAAAQYQPQPRRPLASVSTQQHTQTQTHPDADAASGNERSSGDGKRPALLAPLDASWTIAGCDDSSSDPAQSDDNSRSMEGSDVDVDVDVDVEIFTQSEEVIEKQQQPLDLKSCFRHLWEKGELYRGAGPIVATLATSNFVFFFMNETMKRVLLPSASVSGSHSSQKSHKSRSAPYLSLLASCLAGICNVLITNPLWVANLKIVTGTAESSSLLTEIQNVARREGLPGLWKGTGTSVLLVSNPVIQFFLYEQLKNARLSRRKQSVSGKSLTPGEAFLLGALAKGVATVLTYPLQLTQFVLRLQQRSNNNDTDNNSADSAAAGDQQQQQQQQRYRGTLDCLVKLYQRDGARGLFHGMKAKLLQTVLTAAFTFLTYEQILHAVHSAHKTLLAKQSLRQ